MDFLHFFCWPVIRDFFGLCETLMNFCEIMEYPVGLLAVHGRFQRGRRPFEGLWLRYVASGCLRLSALVSGCAVMCAAGLLFYLSVANICFSVSKIH